MTPEQIAAKVNLVLKPLREAGVSEVEQTAILEAAKGVVTASIAMGQMVEVLAGMVKPKMELN